MSKCCVTGQPCTVEPCAKCPDHPIAEFHPWLDTYGTKAEYDRGDMAACWHAAQRALTAAQTEELSSIKWEGCSYLDICMALETRLPQSDWPALRALYHAAAGLPTTVSPRARTETKDPTDTEFDPPSLR